MLGHSHFLLHPLQFIIHSVLNSLDLQTVLLSKPWIILFIHINQLDALNFIISLFQASTCFEHMCLKHVEAWNKLIKFSASSWLMLINKYIEMHGQQYIKISWIICLFVESLKLFHLNEVRYPFFFVGREVLVVTGITKVTSYCFLVSIFDLRYLNLISSTRCPCASKCNLTAKKENIDPQGCTYGHLKMKRSPTICLHWDLKARW